MDFNRNINLGHGILCYDFKNSIWNTVLINCKVHIMLLEFLLYLITVTFALGAFDTDCLFQVEFSEDKLSFPLQQIWMTKTSLLQAHTLINFFTSKCYSNNNRDLWVPILMGPLHTLVSIEYAEIWTESIDQFTFPTERQWRTEKGERGSELRVRGPLFLVRIIINKYIS